MSRAQQRGSVVGFVVVGVLLTGLVLGGLYVVKNQVGDQLGGASEEKVTAVVDETGDDATDASIEIDQANEQKKAEADKEAAAKQKQADAEAAREREQAAAEKSTDTSNVDNTDNSDSTDNNQPVDDAALPATGMAAEALPETGATDTLMAIIGLTTLTGAVVAYRRSSLI